MRGQEDNMVNKFKAVITRDERWYVSHCVELGVVSQGKTIEEAQANLREAVELYLESFGTEDVPNNTGEIILYPLEVTTSG
jgi:predicted RNase H-like HicB family nuclease